MSTPRPSTAPSDQFSASRTAPLIATVALAAFLLLVAWWVFDAARRGTIEAHPGDGASTNTIAYVIAGVAAAGGVFALSRVPAILTRRFEIGRNGVTYGRGSHVITVPWDRVQAVRTLVLISTRPMGRTPLPHRARTTTRMSLELSLRDAALSEGHQPALTRLRIPGQNTEGYTHHIQLGPGPLFPSPDPALFAPQVQVVLAHVAQPIYHGVVIRQTATTWTRSGRRS